jgi:hypothetical protein
LGYEVVVVVATVVAVIAIAIVVAIANLVLVFYDIFLQNTLLLRRTGNTANVQEHNVYIGHLPYHLPIDN